MASSLSAIVQIKGIGIGICKRIVSDHRGRIHIGDSPLGCTQFNIMIPVEKRNENP